MLTTNAARETHKHLNIRLTRRTIASEISGSSGSSEYDAAADIVEEWKRIESAVSSSDVIVENLCSTPGSPAGDEPASKNTAIRHVAAIRQNKVQPTDSSEGVASISATPIVLKGDYVPYDVQDIASRDGSPRLSPTTEEAASSPPSLEKRRETFGSGEWDKVPANAEVSSSPVEDMATMINALADRIAALPAPTSSIVPANVRAPAPFESSGSSTSAKEKTSAHPAMTGPTDPVGPGGERVKSPRLPIDSPNEAESEAVEYTFYIYNNLHAKKTPMIKHCKSLPLLKDVCAWIEDMWGATPEPNEILAHESPNETEIKIQHWLNKEVSLCGLRNPREADTMTPEIRLARDMSLEVNYTLS